MKFKFIIHILIIFVGFLAISSIYIFIFLKPKLVVMANNRDEIDYLSRVNASLITFRLSVMEINNLDVTKQSFNESFDENLKRIQTSSESFDVLVDEGVTMGSTEDAQLYKEMQEGITFIQSEIEARFTLVGKVMEYDPLKDFFSSVKDSNYNAILGRVEGAEEGLKGFSGNVEKAFDVEGLLDLLGDLKSYGLKENDEGIEKVVVDFIKEYSSLKTEAYKYTINPIKTQKSIDTMVKVSNTILQNQTKIDTLSRENAEEGELVRRLSGFLNVF